jgi:hypothetical protein
MRYQSKSVSVRVRLRNCLRDHWRGLMVRLVQDKLIIGLRYWPTSLRQRVVRGCK